MDYLMLLNMIMMNIVLPTAATVVSVFVSIWLKKYLAKQNIEIEGLNITKFTNLASQSAKYAEQEAAKYYKETGNRMESSKKMETAVSWFIMNTPTLQPETAEKWIEAILGDSKLGATK